MTNSLIAAIQNTVSISLFNKGLAGKIFSDVKKDGAKVVMKNNNAECVLLSPEEYVKLMDEVNDARLLAIAMERMKHYDPDKNMTQEEVNAFFHLSSDDLCDTEGIEFE